MRSGKNMLVIDQCSTAEMTVFELNRYLPRERMGSGFVTTDNPSFERRNTGNSTFVVFQAEANLEKEQWAKRKSADLPRNRCNVFHSAIGTWFRHWCSRISRCIAVDRGYKFDFQNDESRNHRSIGWIRISTGIWREPPGNVPLHVRSFDWSRVDFHWTIHLSDRIRIEPMAKIWVKLTNCTSYAELKFDGANGQYQSMLMIQYAYIHEEMVVRGIRLPAASVLRYALICKITKTSCIRSTKNRLLSAIFRHQMVDTAERREYCNPPSSFFSWLTENICAGIWFSHKDDSSIFVVATARRMFIDNSMMHFHVSKAILFFQEANRQRFIRIR